MIGDHNFPLRLSHHAAVHLRLVGIQASQAVLYVDAIDSDEKRIDEYPAHGLHGRRPDHRKPISAQMTSGHEDINILAVAQLHGYVHGIGNNGDAILRAQVAYYLCRGCACGECDGFSRHDEFGGCMGNAALFVRITANLVLKRPVMPEGLIEKWLNGQCASVGAPKQTPHLQVLQISPHRGHRHFQHLAKFLYGDRACLLQLPQYDGFAGNLFVNSFCHFLLPA